MPPAEASNSDSACVDEPLLHVSSLTKPLDESQPATNSHVTVLLNPVGGNGRALKLFNRVCRPILAAAGFRIDLRQTRRVNHATELAADLPDLGAGLMVVGGDGLVQEVVTGLRSRSDRVPPLAIVPGGTANALANMLYGNGCLGRNCVAARAAHALVAGVVRGIDLLQVDLGSGPRYALSLVGAGLAATVAERADHMRWMPGARHYRYELAGLLTLLAGRGWRAQLSYPLDGTDNVWVDREMELINMLAVNHAKMGKSRRITTHAEIDDGFVQLVIVPQMPRHQVISVLGAMSQGKVLEEQPEVISLRVREFKLLLEPTNKTFNVDGDVLPGHQVHVKVLHKAIAVFAEPPSCDALPCRCKKGSRPSKEDLAADAAAAAADAAAAELPAAAAAASSATCSRSRSHSCSASSNMFVDTPAYPRAASLPSDLNRVSRAMLPVTPV